MAVRAECTKLDKLINLAGCIIRLSLVLHNNPTAIHNHTANTGSEDSGLCYASLRNTNWAKANIPLHGEIINRSWFKINIVFWCSFLYKGYCKQICSNSDRIHAFIIVVSRDPSVTIIILHHISQHLKQGSPLLLLSSGIHHHVFAMKQIVTDEEKNHYKGLNSQYE